MKKKLIILLGIFILVNIALADGEEEKASNKLLKAIDDFEKSNPCNTKKCARLREIVKEKENAYGTKCVIEVNKEWGATPAIQIKACHDYIDNEFAFRCVAALVTEWVRIRAMQIKACKWIKTEAGAMCVEDVVKEWGSTKILEITSCRTS